MKEIFGITSMKRALDIDKLHECYDVQLLFDNQITQEGWSFALSYAMWKLDI